MIVVRMELGIIAVIGGIVLMVFILGVFLILGIKKALELLFNSIIGFFALWLTKTLFLPTLVINLWSVLITAIFGIVGFVIVVVLHFVGIF